MELDLVSAIGQTSSRHCFHLRLILLKLEWKTLFYFILVYFILTKLISECRVGTDKNDGRTIQGSQGCFDSPETRASMFFVWRNGATLGTDLGAQVGRKLTLLTLTWQYISSSFWMGFEMQKLWEIKVKISFLFNWLQKPFPVVLNILLRKTPMFFSA